MPQDKSPRRLQLLGVLFVAVVVAVILHSQQLVIPVFLGLIAWGKVWLKKLTPKLAMLLAKNSLILQLRRFAMRASAHLFVKSHRPWRRFLTKVRVALVTAVGNLFSGYMNLPLWLRTAIALAVLIATAGSSFAIFALLIIPQPLLNWLGTRLGALLHSLGLTQLLSTLWDFLMPEALRHRWYMFLKWTLGRQQVKAAKLVHNKVALKPSEDSGAGGDSDDSDPDVANPP